MKVSKFDDIVSIREEWSCSLKKQKKKWVTSGYTITQNLLPGRNKPSQKFAEINTSFKMLSWKDSIDEILIVFTSVKTSFTRIVFNSTIQKWFLRVSRIFRTKQIFLNLRSRFLITVTLKYIEKLTIIHFVHFSPLLCFYRNQLFGLVGKLIDWFLYEMQLWTEIG